MSGAEGGLQIRAFISLKKELLKTISHVEPMTRKKHESKNVPLQTITLPAMPELNHFR